MENTKIQFKPVPKNFRTIGEVSIVKTSEIAKMVNDMFAKVFADYHGSIIEIRYDAKRNYFLNPILQFRVLQKDQYNFDKDSNGVPKNFYGFNRMDVHGTETNLLGRVQRFAANAAKAGPRVEMTEEFKEILKPYMITSQNGSIDWNNVFTTVVYGGNTYIRVGKIDILKLLKAVYGEKDPVTGSDLYYQPTLSKPVIGINQYNMANPAMAGSYDDWWVSVLRLNAKNEAYVAEQQGIMFNSNSMPGNIITDRV